MPAGTTTADRVLVRAIQLAEVLILGFVFPNKI